MKNVNELRNELSTIFDDLKTGVRKPQEVAELVNLAGKMINSAKVQVEYYVSRKEVPKIDFLADDKG